MESAHSQERRGPRGSVAVTLSLAVVVFCAPLLTHRSLPLGSDVYSTTHYLQGFMKAFSEGDLYPRWTDRSNQDLGAPSFVMFPPLTYYAAGAACWLTGSIINGFKLYLFVLAVATVSAFYVLAKQWIGPGLPAALAAAVYLLAPYHVLDLYQRFAISESTAFVFTPLVLLFARRTIDAGRLADFVGLSLAYAGLIYTHLVSALMVSLFLGLWLLWELRHRHGSIPRVAASLLCGLGLAAPFLLPAVIEKWEVNIAWNKEMPNGDFRLNFIFKDDVLPGLGIKDPVKPPVLRSAHAQLFLALAAAGIGLLCLPAGAGRRRGDIKVLTAGCLLAYGLQVRIATPIWEIVPELASIQFPWRFQTIMVLTTALLVGFAASSRWTMPNVARVASRRVFPAALSGISVMALVNLLLAYQNAHLKPFSFDAEAARATRVVHWIEPAFTPVQFKAYRRFKMMTIRMPRAGFRRSQGRVRVVEWTSSHRRLEMSSEQGGTVVIRSFWFPGWVGTIDGRSLDLAPLPDIGVVSFDVPSGDHTITLDFARSPVRTASLWVGLTMLLVTPLLGIWSDRRRAGRD